MIAMIDNYDSFTYNLVQYLGERGAEVRVFRNDEVSAEAVLGLAPSHIVISPGPCAPDQAGISLALIHAAAGRVPLLGVCLGHQAIGQAFGGRVVRAGRVMHGKTSRIRHDGHGVFREIQNDFVATRYHSLVVERDTLDVSASGTLIWHLTLRPAAGADAVRVTETGVLRVTPDEAGAVVYVDREPPYPARFPIGEARMAGTELELQVLPPWSGSTMYRFRFTRLR